MRKISFLHRLGRRFGLVAAFAMLFTQLGQWLESLTAKSTQNATIADSEKSKDAYEAPAYRVFSGLFISDADAAPPPPPSEEGDLPPADEEEPPADEEG